MSNIYNGKVKYLDDKILENCKKFLSHRLIKLYPDKKINISKSFQKFINLPSLNLSSRYDNKITTNNIVKKSLVRGNLNNKSAFIPKNKKIIKIKLNHILEENEKLSIRRITSAKKIKMDKNLNLNINKYITQPKVNEIIKNLLSKNKSKHEPETLPKKICSLKKFINPAKYVDSTMKIFPNNEKLYKSYRQQMKYLIEKKRRKFLIEGVNDYHSNIKLYKEIYFGSVFYNINKYKKPFNKTQILD